MPKQRNWVMSEDMIGEYLVEIMQEQNLTINKLSIACGISRPCLTKFFNGTTKLHLSTRLKLVEFIRNNPLR